MIERFTIPENNYIALNNLFVFQKLSESIKRKKSRYISLKAIQNGEHYNNGVVNLHRIDPLNVGDLFCAPHNYFKSLKNTGIDLYGYSETDPARLENFVERIKENSIIVGGGGLLNRKSFENQLKTLEILADRGKKIVIWGAGHNSKNQRDFHKLKNYNIDIGKFGLAGTRDFSSPGEYIPCVSCLHPALKEDYGEKNEIGLLFHNKSLKNKNLIQRFSEYPKFTNNSNIYEMIGFLGSCEHIITNSYHGMYWGMLLNKKVSVIPNSSKFFDFKYSPNFTSFENCLEDFKKAKKYPGILEESIQLNLEFFEKVSDYLELEV